MNRWCEWGDSYRSHCPSAIWASKVVPNLKTKIDKNKNPRFLSEPIAVVTQQGACPAIGVVENGGTVNLALPYRNHCAQLETV